MVMLIGISIQEQSNSNPFKEWSPSVKSMHINMKAITFNNKKGPPPPVLVRKKASELFELEDYLTCYFFVKQYFKLLE